jgi:hypothetical protein
MAGTASDLIAAARQSIQRGDFAAAVAQARQAIAIDQSPAFVQSAVGQLNDPAGEFVRHVQERLTEISWPDSTGRLAAIGTLRRALALAIWGCPPDLLATLFACFYQAHETLCACDLAQIDPANEDQPLLRELAAADPADPRRLLVAMLFFRAHQIAIPGRLEEIPPWLQQRFIRYIFYPAAVLNDLGEAERIREFLQGWIDYFYDGIVGGSSPRARQAGEDLLRFVNVLRLYSSRSDLREFHCKFSDALDAIVILPGIDRDQKFAPRPVDRQRIRIGILNRSYGPGSETTHTLPAFEYLDRSKFEIILYRLKERDSPADQYCNRRADRVVLLPATLGEGVQRIRADDLDVLLTGSNVTGAYNEVRLLMAHRLARVQCTLLASPHTTGLRNMDFFISGTLGESNNAQSHYRERLELLQGTGFCADYDCLPAFEPAPMTRRRLGIAEDAIVFMSGAGIYKLVPEVVRTFVTILKNTPGSLLCLYPYSAAWSTNNDPVWPLQRLITRTTAQLQVDAKRIHITRGFRSRQDVVTLLRLGDIYLDSFFHSGCHTVVDALQAALPIVAMDGELQRQRQGAALLRELDLPELIAADEESYIAIATALANDAERREHLSQTIEKKMADIPRFLNPADYSAQVGALLEQLVARWQQSHCET